MTTNGASLHNRPRPMVRWGRTLAIAAVAVYLAVLVIGPLAGLVKGTFARGLAEVASALGQPEVLLVFWRTLLIALVTVAVHAVLGTTVAWMLVRYRPRGGRVLNGLIDLPFVVSPVVAGYMLFLLFGARSFLGPLLDAYGIKVAFALPGMILATLFVTFPFMIRELMPVLAAFGTEQEQAAATCGASGWQVFWRVTLPALRWGFIYGITLTFARALGEFGAVLVIGGALQGRTETATLYVYRALEERQYVAAYSVALVLGLVSAGAMLGTEIVRRRER